MSNWQGTNQERNPSDVTGHQEATPKTNQSTQIRKTGDTPSTRHGMQELRDAILMIGQIGPSTQKKNVCTLIGESMKL